MKGLSVLATWLLIIGGLNWGLVAINADWNIVANIFGGEGGRGIIAIIVYALVGLSALVVLFNQFSGEEK